MPLGTIMVQPSAGWNGTAASGFGGSYGAVPTNPTRTTAKPAMRLITPPHQAFTDTLLVGVSAMANNGGSLLDNMGLEKVTLHFEGNTVDITAPSFQTFNDANGNPVTYYGWWAYLKHPGTNGHGRVYFEAVPKDATLQHRVIGPYQFSPQAAVHDYSVAVAASGGTVAGVTYPTLNDAMNYLRTLNARFPLITITEAGLYALNDEPAKSWITDGHYTVTASVSGVSVGKSSYTTDAAGTQRLARVQTRFKGENLTVDFEYLTEFNLGFFGWFDGCRIAMDGTDGRNKKRRGQPQLLYTWAFAGNTVAWLTECSVEKMNWIGTNVELARGCTMTDMGADLFNQARCVIGNRISHHSNVYWNTDRPIFSVTYTGSEATATFTRSGAQGGGNFTANWGANSATLTMGITEADYLGSTGNGYWPSDVVDWINTTLAGMDAGWSATLIDDTWLAAYATTEGGKGVGFTNINVKNTTFEVQVVYDTHGDFWQQNDTTMQENVIVADNIAYDIETQCLFVSPVSNSPIKDMVFVNNAFHVSETPSDYWDADVLLSQFGRTNTAISHLVIAHCTFANQGIRLFSSDVSATWDGYCMFANNVSRTMFWNGGNGVADADLVIANNHLHVGATIPAVATGTTIGGDETSLFVARLTGDLSPAGELLTNLKAPKVEYDMNRQARKAKAAAGALA